MTSKKELVLQSLIERKLVLNQHDGKRWLMNVKIPGFGDKTAAELISNGHSDAVLKHIERMVDLLNM